MIKMAASTEKMNQLIKKREEIEIEIKELNDVLNSQKSVGMDEPVVDTEGYPRSDIDIYTVRHARHQIICLQNDYKDIMEQIEEELYRIHAAARKQSDSDHGSASGSNQTGQATQSSDPLGTVTSIDEGSPAERAGLKVGDSVIQFGSLTSENFQGLQNIASIVQHSVNKPIPLKVLRDDKEMKLSLIPTRWKPDKGLLGCNIKPVLKK